MSLAHGRPYLAIPGPSVAPDRVLQAMHRPSPNIYAGELPDLTASLVPDLKGVAKTEGHVAMYIGNGHAAWEASLANVLAPGDVALALPTGRFGHGWAEMARRIGIEIDVIDFGNQSDIDLARVEAALRADKTGRIKAILAVQVDTSTSVKNDIQGLRRVLDMVGHDALLTVDSIACLGVDEMHMDAWGVDICLTGSQKGLMTPAGMAFVFFNDKAAEVRAKMERVSSYWDWTPRAHPEEFFQYFFGTAPTHHIYGLREALNMLVHEEGVEAAWARHAVLARAVWAAFDVWAHPEGLALNIKDPAKRSNAVTSASAPAPKATELREFMEREIGVTLGIGIGMAPGADDPAWHGYFRIGHMGHVNPHMLLGVLGGMEAGLQALGIPHQAGGVTAAASVIAEATS